MQPAPVVVLFEPSDEMLALALSSTLEVLGVRCWLDGVEGSQGPSRLQAITDCRAIVVVRDEAGGAYGALDAGAMSGRPVFVYARGEGADERARMKAFCATVAAAVGPVAGGGATRSVGLPDLAWPRELSGRKRDALVAAVAIAVVAALGTSAAVGLMIARQHRPGIPLLTTRSAVALSATPSNSGWMLVFRLPEAPAEVFYELDSSPGYHTTGVNPAAFDAGGTPLAKTYVMLGKNEVRGPTTVRVKYRLPGGSVEGPFALPFDPAAQALVSAKSTLEDIAGNWVSFNENGGRMLAYFTTVLVYKHALSEVNIGVDGGPLDRHLRFVPSDVPYAGIGDGDEMFRALSPGVRSVSVQLVFRDGTRSPVRTFDVPPLPEPVVRPDPVRPRNFWNRPTPPTPLVPPTSLKRSGDRSDPFTSRR